MDVSRIGLGLASLLLAAAAIPSPAAEPKDRIYQVEAVDEEMNAAKAKAIAELPSFYRALAAPSAGEGEFMIKFDIVPGDEAEFVWANQLDRSSRPMTGILLNRPEYSDSKPATGSRAPRRGTSSTGPIARRGDAGRAYQSGPARRIARDGPRHTGAYLGW